MGFSSPKAASFGMEEGAARRASICREHPRQPALLQSPAAPRRSLGPGVHVPEGTARCRSRGNLRRGVVVRGLVRAAAGT